MTAAARGRPLSDNTLLIATGNAGKLREFARLLSPRGVTPLSAADFGIPEAAETGDSFSENALIKARAAAAMANRPALADDSGLCVAALNDAPGVYSARLAGPKRDFTAAMRELETQIAASPTPQNRDARFVCVLALVWPDGHEETFEGEVRGVMVWPPRGDNGFGYDPVFQPLGSRRTFAEMSAAEKERLAHRSRAFERLAAACLPPLPA